MQIRVAPGALPQLEHPEDFRAFRIVAVCEPDRHDLLRAALGEAAVPDDAGHAWVSEAWVRRASGRAAESAWQDGMRAMVAYARSKGWWRDGPPRIRAHIVWEPPTG